MLTAIQFNYQFIFKIYEIYNISANWMLTSKLITHYLPISNVPP